MKTEKNNTRDKREPTIMNDKIFWAMINLAHERSGGDMNKKCQFIREEIMRLSEMDATLFADLFERQLDRTYTWALQDAAEIILGRNGSSYYRKVEFEIFRVVLMSMGRQFYDLVIDNPEIIAKVNLERENWKSENCWCAVVITIEKMLGYYPKRLGISPNFRSGESWGERKRERLPLITERFSS